MGIIQLSLVEHHVYDQQIDKFWCPILGDGFVRNLQKGAAEFDDFWGLKWAEQEVILAETSDDLESIVSGCINTSIVSAKDPGPILGFIP